MTYNQTIPIGKAKLGQGVSSRACSDTHPYVEHLQIELMRQAPAWRKAELWGQMVETMQQLALSGLRQRHPQADEAELRRRLADLLLGPDLAARVYGPMPDGEQTDVT